MKTFVIVSDSHRNRAAIDKLSDIMSESDYIVHLGDLSSDGGYIRSKFPQKTFVLNGNCDFERLGDDEIVTTVEGVKILMCHGDRYSVKQGLGLLAQKAEQSGCKVALYGHTHIADSHIIDGVKLINPGSLTRFGEQSYCYMVINQGKVIEKIVKL